MVSGQARPVSGANRDDGPHEGKVGPFSVESGPGPKSRKSQILGPELVGPDSQLIRLMQWLLSKTLHGALLHSREN